jgi:mono/diheme cytochrome c family protein
VHTFKGARPAIRNSDLVPVHLRPGPVTILAKIYNITAACGFHCTLGGYAVEVLAQRLGSDLKPKIRLGFGNDWIADGHAIDGGDCRLEWDFDKSGQYGLQIEDADGGGGPNCAYRIEIGSIKPEYSLETFPANPAVPRGGRTLVAVRRTSLQGYWGDIKLRLEGLPPGLSADSPVLAPDHDHNLVLLEAAPDAPPGFAAIRVEGDAPSAAGPISVRARPLDHFKLQNDPIPLARNSMAAAVLATEAPFTVDALTESLTAYPDSTAVVKVRVTRHNYNGDIFVTLWGLPNGQRVEGVPLGSGQTEAELRFKFPGNFLIGASQDPTAYRLLAVGFAGGDGLTGGTMLCSRPIRLIPPAPGATAPVAAAATAATVADGGGAALYQRRCASCHALPDPKRKTAEQWGATVTRMIQQNNARISDADKDAILKYLATMAQK